MHIVFVNHSNFIGNSGIHITPLANLLVEMEHKVTVFVPDDPNSVRKYMGNPFFDVRAYNDDRRLSHCGDIIFHAWTPREKTRKQTRKLAKEYNAPYFVHLEDNEERLLGDALGQTYSYLEGKSTDELDKLVPNHLSHPHRYKDFINEAFGASCIIESLEKFIPKMVPALTFWPACENAMFNIPEEIDLNVRKNFDLPEDAIVLAYLGTMHHSNQHEVSALYKAIGLLNNDGRCARLIRIGHNSVPFFLGADKIENNFSIELGNRHKSEAVNYLSASDILVQPGTVNDFNKYRFPSKVPMFLASGRPVILPDVNIGEHLTDWENCIKIVTGNPEEIAHKIALLSDHPLLSKAIGKKGKSFAREHFCWQKSADKLINFYQKCLLDKKN